MTRYECYGLAIDSELLLPELPPRDAATAAVTIRFAELPLDLFDDANVRYKPLSAREIYVFFRNVGTALVRGGEEVLLQAAPGVDEVTLRLFVLQQVIGVVLLQRGLFVLHASAAAIDGKAFAFAGESGQGKSTLAAALNERGGAILTDDVFAIDLANPKQPMARAGLTQLKLTEEGRRTFSPVADQQIGEKAKRLCAMGAPQRIEAVPLAAVYILATGKDLRREAIPPARAAVELVRHTYGFRLLPHIGLAESHFRQAAALVSNVPIYRLTRPRDLSRLAETLRLIAS